jgi:hypothetical protein
MSNWMLDIFNRQNPVPQASTMPAPQAMQGQSPMQPPARPVAGVMPAPQAPSGGMDVMQVMQAKPPGVDPQTWLAVCGPGMQGPAGGGNGRVGFRTANGDTGLQGANMPQPQRPSLLDGLLGTPMQGGGGMFGVTRPAPQPNGPMPYGGMGFGGGAPQQGVGAGVSQMPAFQAPQPMPLMPQQPMPGMQPYNFSQQMGQTAPPSPMTGQMKGMFGVR